jgi:PAS domain S-box-containing protein
MKYQENKPDSASRLASESNLRRNAEAQLLSNQLNAPSIPQPIDLSTLQPLNSSTPPLSDTDTLKLIHELQVHQIELELQNEELVNREKKAVLDAEKYAELFDHAPSGYFTLSRQGEIIELNFSGANILDSVRSKLINSRFGFFVSHETKPIFSQFLDQVFSGYDKKSCEVVLSTNNKKESHVYLSGVADKNGENCLITLVDITESKFLKALQQSEERYQTIIEWSPHAVILHRDLKIIYANPVALRMFGAKSAQDLIGSSIMDRIHPDYLQIIRKRIDLAMNEGRTAPFIELKYFKVDGTIIDVEVQGTPVIYDGIPTIQASIRDITESKRIEKEKARQTGLITSLLDSIPDIVFYKDTNGVYLGCNRPFTEITGKGRNEIIGNTDSDLFSHEVAESFRHHDIEMMKRKLPRHNEEWITYPDGRRILLDTLKTPYWDSNETLIGMIGVSRDITERKDAENKIKEIAKDLGKLNAEKDKFFSIIAHDLRSPFNGFLGLTELMVEQLSTLTKQEIYTISLSLKNSATKLFCLLENLLQWSRMQQGLIPFHPETLQLLPIVKGSLSIIIESARIKNIEITYDIPDELTISGDINMLLSVLRNLASNALKFTPSGGIINISAITSGSTIEISVKDSGIGMSSEIVKDLFRIDAKNNRPGTEGEPSSGLGLLLCKDFIEKHKGEIRVVSEVGKGSTFYFTIPINGQTEETQLDTDVIKEQTTKKQFQKLKVLIVEDDLASEKFLAITIKTLSRDIIKVRTGVEAVKVCLENPDIDLVLMDIAMPGMDGYEATRQIRQFNPEVVIIAQTANTQALESELAMAAGCNDFIPKPLNQYLVREMIYKHFSTL